MQETYLQYTMWLDEGKIKIHQALYPYPRERTHDLIKRSTVRLRSVMYLLKSGGRVYVVEI